MTPAAAFQVNPAAIVGRFAAHYSARHQQTPVFAPLTTLGGWRLQGLFSNALHKCKMNFPGAARLDSGTINQYFVRATCTSGCKPEERVARQCV